MVEFRKQSTYITSELYLVEYDQYVLPRIFSALSMANNALSHLWSHLLPIAWEVKNVINLGEHWEGY